MSSHILSLSSPSLPDVLSLSQQSEGDYDGRVNVEVEQSKNGRRKKENH